MWQGFYPAVSPASSTMGVAYTSNWDGQDIEVALTLGYQLDLNYVVSKTPHSDILEGPTPAGFLGDPSALSFNENSFRYTVIMPDWPVLMNGYLKSIQFRAPDFAGGGATNAPIRACVGAISGPMTAPSTYFVAPSSPRCATVTATWTSGATVTVDFRAKNLRVDKVSRREEEGMLRPEMRNAQPAGLADSCCCRAV
jgi:hypothetical protein